MTDGEEQELLKKYPCPEYDPSKARGVLLNNEIEYYANKYKMIDPFNPKNLKPAGYELTLGEEYAIGGKPGKLTPERGKEELRIPPFEVAIITTKEIINLPRFIIARWNLRVKWVYEGLLWTGALQVDPGWVGKLPCPIYNLSSEEVILKLGEPVALMDFVTTSDFVKDLSIEYRRPPKRTNLKEYSYRLKSALYTGAAQRIEDVDKKVRRVESLIGLLFTCIAILFAALSILVLSTQKTSIYVPVWLYLSVFLSIAAIAISLFLRVKLEKDRGLKILMIIYMIVSAVVIALLVAKIF